MRNSQQHNDWLSFSVDQIIGGRTADGLRYLELFLQDYSRAFNTRPNANCTKCIATYLRNYKSKFSVMSKSKYVLKKKYEGIQLGFGSGIFVTNSNMTDELGEKLFKWHSNPESLFASYPKPKKKAPKKEKSSTKKK